MVWLGGGDRSQAKAATARDAAKFQVAVESDKNRYKLRLLSPLYRYKNAKADILDGVLYAFVEGTDPELIRPWKPRGSASLGNSRPAG